MNECGRGCPYTIEESRSYINQALQLNFPPLKERELPLSPWLHSHGSLHKPLWQSFIPQLTCWKASEYPNDQSRPFV